MSVRRAPLEHDHAELVKRELALLQATAQAAARADAAAVATASMAPCEAFEALSPPEQATAMLGVHPDALRPIQFMNNAHHEALLKANALDDTLARRIEAYRHVAAS